VDWQYRWCTIRVCIGIETITAVICIKARKGGRGVLRESSGV
jgi:hypothetical protein